MPNQASSKDPAVAVTSSASSLPFDSERLDRLMEASGIDVLLVTSKHNLQYMLDGYRFFFFDYSDAIGISRYLPILIYPAGRPEKAVYIGNAMENSEHENGCFWYLHFVAHGMGIIGHEAPRLTDRGPVTYPGVDAELPLEPGMVLSVETTMLHSRRGMVKLEDTLLVTSDGFEAVGDDGRGWNLPRG